MGENKIDIIGVESTQTQLIPREQVADYKVTVKNDSNNYADIQLQLTSPNENSTSYWYHLSPEVSSLIPPGALTEFSIEIFDSPKPGFVGKMNINVDAFSTDTSNQSTRKVINLDIQKSTLLQPAIISLLPDYLEKSPDNTEFQILVNVHNPNQEKINTKLKLWGLDPSWILDQNTEAYLELEPDKEARYAFCLKLSNINKPLSKVYSFKVEATHIKSEPAYAEGKLKVSPQGILEFICNPAEIQEIAAESTWKFWLANDVNYELIFDNRSNVNQNISVGEIQDQDQPLCTFVVNPETSQLAPGETNQLDLTVNCRRHWLGKPKSIERVIDAIWSERENLDTHNESQKIALLIKPIIPFWLQIGGVGLLLCLFWWLLFKPLTKHASSVNSVQFNGVGENIISASDDQSIIAWRVSGFNFFKFWANPKIRKIGSTGKPVNVVSIRPIDNNLVVAGLDNGEIQIWDLLSNSKTPKYCFYDQKDDRVLALEFSHDSRYLFSGHGSGLVHQWDLSNPLNCSSEDSPNKNSPIQTKKLDFVASSLKFIGEDHENLAISGRFNSLVVWNPKEDIIKKIPYPRLGGQNDYIESLSTAEAKPNLLATADNQGYITILNMQNCLEGNSQSCGKVIDRWNTGHNQQPVRSVALSANACYLVSGGNDGKMVFWPLTGEGKRSGLFNNSNGKAIGNSFGQQKFSSVDIKIVQNHLLITGGSKDSWITLKREKRQPELGCDRP
ncbi:hypothetical protein [Anabaena sp. UHCC 0204]|uniref:hypothetical protein n=1 Tax=Anabaena sp. UHCC 0204 TaxID=2590009 RepID=UPI001445AC9C|nr:hypothetical protein [Anabaena sp. UHCC 0204]MTJ08129.1 hypothetical protein [Anabaena sp. UHCC 0204]